MNDSAANRAARRQIALVYPVAVPWAALFVRGVMDYAGQHGGWSLTVSPPALRWAGEQSLTLESLRRWPGHGIIAAIANPADARVARRLGKPVVNMSASTAQSAFPRVMPDHYGMGRLAAEHLLERGLRRLAYCGFAGLWFSELRRQGFVDRAAKAGVPCQVLELPVSRDDTQDWQRRIAPLTQFLQEIVPPVGLLAVQDYRARTLVDECHRLGLRIPHDVAVVGIDDDPTVCEYCQPTITSVSRNAWRLGHETAALLDRLMEGGSPPGDDILVPSDGIVARQSTDTIAVDDAHVAAAVHFIHDHPELSYGVDRVVEAARVSRRLLEVRFRRTFGCSIYDYICRQRLERARRLLAAPDRMKLNKLAAFCGFSSLEQMRLVFKRFLGMSPLEYRQDALAR